MSQKESVEVNHNNPKNDVTVTVVTPKVTPGKTIRRSASLRPRRSLLKVRSVRPLKAVLNTKSDTQIVEE